MTTALIQPKTIFHINDGAVTMNGVDANTALANGLSREWSAVPWTPELLEQVEARLKRIEDEKNARPYGAMKRE